MNNRNSRDNDSKEIALAVVDVREAALIYDLSESAIEDENLHITDRIVAERLHKDFADLLGRKP